MTQLKISIIIPCYNAEEYIVKTLESVVSQKHTNWECIIINDGSIDNSKKLIKGFIKNDNRFQLYTQKNKGLSYTRNKGIELASGDYIYFLDSDDLLDINSLFYLTMLINKNTNIDIVIGKTAITTNHNHNTVDIAAHHLPRNQVLYNKNLILLEDVVRYPLACIAANRLLNRDFILQNKIFFKEGILHEDELFHFECLIHCNSILLSDKTTYYYNNNNTNSITQNKTEKNTLDYLDILFIQYHKYYLYSKFNNLEKQRIAFYIYNFKKIIYDNYTTTPKKHKALLEKTIQKKFKKIQVPRTIVFKSRSDEKLMYKFYVVSFLKPKYINIYFKSFFRRNLKDKIIYKYLFYKAYYFNRKTIKKFYNYN